MTESQHLLRKEYSGEHGGVAKVSIQRVPTSCTVEMLSDIFLFDIPDVDVSLVRLFNINDRHGREEYHFLQLYLIFQIEKELQMVVSKFLKIPLQNYNFL